MNTGSRSLASLLSCFLLFTVTSNSYAHKTERHHIAPESVIFAENQFSDHESDEVAEDTELRGNIILTTICGRTIPGNVHSDPDDYKTYNCHSYAWYYRGQFNSNDRMSIPDPLYYITSYPSCFSLVSSINSVKKGDIIVYKQDSSLTPARNRKTAAHSGLVVRIDIINNRKVPIIHSKHGLSNVFSTVAYDQSFYYRYGYNNEYTSIVEFYRPSHNVDTSWGANTNYKFYNENLHMVACRYCGRRPSSSPPANEPHTFVTQGSITRCSKCGYRVVPQHSISNNYSEGD